MAARLALTSPRNSGSENFLKYRNYKKFTEPEFLGKVTASLAAINLVTYDEFENLIKQTLDKHAPIKTAIHRENNKPYVHKEMRKALMKRTQLKNIANKTKSQDDIQKYKVQRNLLVKMIGWEKDNFMLILC